MIEASPDNNFEVTMLDVPEGAETLLLEDGRMTVRGRLQGPSRTVTITYK